MRTGRGSPARQCGASAVMASSAARAASIRGRMVAPKTVGRTPRVLRSNSRAPRIFSRRRMALDSAGWVTSYSRAAALKEPVRATAWA